jgi:hypothetical protein
LIGPIALITSAGDAVTNLKDQTDFKSRLLEIIAGLKNQVSSHINVNDFGTFHQAGCFGQLYNALLFCVKDSVYIVQK